METSACAIQLFGGLKVIVGDREITRFSGQKCASLLAYLAYFSHRSHSREALIETLWPECDPESGRNRLSVTLSRLRRDLDCTTRDGSSLLLADRHQIGLNTNLAYVDVFAFYTHLLASENASSDQARLRSLQAALTLYREPLLPDFYDDWISAEQERLRDAYYRAACQVIEYLEAQGQYEEALLLARQAVAIEPLQEAAQTPLIRLLIRTGRQAEAHKQYNALEQHLRETLQLAPSPALQALIASLSRAYGQTVRTAPVSPDVVPTIAPLAESITSEAAAANEAPAPVVSTAHSEGSTSHRRFISPRRRGLLVGGLMLTLILAARGNWRAPRSTASGSVPLSSVLPVRNVPVTTRGNLSPTLSKTPSSPSLAARTETAGSRASMATVPVSHASSPASARKQEGGKLLWMWKDELEADVTEKGCEPTAMTSDAEGNLYVTGFVHTKQQDVDYLTIKFNAKGDLLWKRRFNSVGNDCDRARAIAVDEQGNVYVTGECYHGDREQGGTQYDIVTVKYSSAGKELKTLTYNGAPNNEDIPIGLALDRDNNLYVAGKSFAPGRRPNAVLMKYDPEGNNLWTETTPTPKESESVLDFAPHAFLPANNDTLLMTGESVMQDAKGNERRYVLTSRYDLQGNQVWPRRFQVKQMFALEGRALTVDDANNVYVAAALHPLFTGHGSPHDDILAVKYDANGNKVWSAEGLIEDAGKLGIPDAIVAGKDGRVFIQVSMGWGDTASGRVHYLVALSPQGKLLWKRRTPYVRSRGLQVTAEGDLVCSGETNDGHEGLPPSRLLAWRLGADGKQSWKRTLYKTDHIEQNVLHRDHQGNVITVGRVWEEAIPRFFLVKYAP